MNTSTDTYLSLLLSLPNIDPQTLLSAFFLTIARIIPLMAVVPFLGPKLLSNPVRMMFSIALCAIFLPQNLLSLQSSIPFGAAFIGFSLKELLIGFFLAVFASIPFWIASSSGNLIEQQRGSSALQVSDPTTQIQSSDIGNLYNYCLLVLFFVLGGPFLFFESLATSFQLLPIDRYVPALLFSSPSIPLWKTVLELFNHVMSLSIQLAAPSLIGLFLTDLFLGISNRLAPQVQIIFLGMPLKSWVGIALLTAAWSLILQVMSREAIDWIKALQPLLLKTFPSS